MDNLWQNKCSLTYTVGSSSSSPVQSQQSRNHPVIIESRYLYPHVEQESRFRAQERVPEPPFLNTNQKPCHYAKPPINNSCVLSSSGRSEDPLTPSHLISDTLIKQKPKIGTGYGPVFFSSAANFSTQSSDLAQAVLHQNGYGNEKVMGNYSTREEWERVTNFSISAKLQRHFDTSENISAEKHSSLSGVSFNFLSGCSRVLCLSICGDLLFSDTGLLGVVCSCHCLHMSISKFCEHSGLYDINPGHAVHMDSGETIARWRRLYFQKFGIRVPDDHCGWDWPEGFSATAALIKSNLTMPSNPNNADFYRFVGSTGTSVRSRQTRDTIPLSENSVTNQNHLNDILHNNQQRNDQDSCNVLFKGLTGPSHSNFRPASDSLMYQNSSMSKFVESKESDNGSMSKSRNSFTFEPTLQNLRIFYDSNLRKDSNPKEAINFDQDAVSSNIELKLGQPYQQSWSSGNTLSTLGDLPKSVSQNHLIHSKHNFGSTNKFIQYPQQVSSTSNFCSTKEKNLTNLMNYALGGNYDVNVTKTEKCREDATKSSVISIPLSHINTTSEENVHSRAYYSTHNANERSMHREVRCESHIGKSCAIKFPCNRDNGLEIPHGSLSKNISEGIEAGCVTDANFAKRMGNLSFLNGKASGSGSCNPKSTTVNDRIVSPHHVSGMPWDASGEMRFFNYSGKVPFSECSGHFNNVLNKSSNSAINPATHLPYLTTAMSKKESICVSPLLDENLRMLAARHMLELYKQDDANSSPAMTQLGSFNNSIFGADPLSVEQNHRLNVINKTKIIGGEDENLAPREGLKNWCNHSTSMQGNPSCLKEVDMQCQSFHGPLSDKHHPPRLGGNESISSSKGYGKSCQRVPYTCFQSNCNCTIQLQNLGADCNSRLQTPINTLKDQIASVRCKDLASNIGTVCKEPTISLERGGKLDDHMPKKINSHSFQWKDVPNKVVPVCNITNQSSPTKALYGGGCDDNQLEETADNCLKGTEQKVNTLTWKETCSVSSAISTPVVNQESIDVTNTGSCTVDESDGRYVNDCMIDEGSANKKCGSSDDEHFGDKSTEFLGSTCKPNVIKERSSKAFTNQSSCNLIDDIKLLNSLRWKKVQNLIPKDSIIYGKSKSNQLQNVEEGAKCGNIEKDIKQTSSVNNGVSKQNCGTMQERSSSTCNNELMILSSDQGTSHSLGTTSQQPILNYKKSFSTIKTTCRKKDLHKLYSHDIEVDDVYETVHADSLEVPHDSSLQKSIHTTVGSTKAECSLSMNSFIRKARPEVYGKFGIISNGNMSPDMSKPANIILLSKIFKTARCIVLGGCEARSTSKGKLRKRKSKVRCEGVGGISCSKEADSLNYKVNVRKELDPNCSIESEQNGDMHIEKEHPGRGKFRSISNTYIGASSKPKIREIRKRSLSDLIGAEKISSCEPEKRSRSLEKFSSGAVDKCQDGEEWDNSAKKTITEHEYKSFISDPAEFCCVCGGSNKDDINCLLKCSFCLIRVHQACYGVVKVPKGSWCCRPCRTSSKDIACVLCGYGGGAMTRALQSDNIVKGILKAWNIETVHRMEDEDYYSGASIDELGNLNSKKQKMVTNTTGSSCKLKNSIIAWVLDFTVKQWVHMVCGLWTPGTRCPNVDTMSAFDVSGASHPRENTVCSMCNRSGGSYIQCRVIDCCVQFHPWCAHQKGLLQSEVEGSENESVGFYGRCVLHATCPPTIYCGETGCPRGETFTCARTEGYKGRKRDGLRCNVNYQSNGNAGCLVSQEQLNVWLHINRQKPCTKGPLKQPISDSEHDCRKEYARYKHAKAWKHLVVYKSGIHALGLYTSQLITRGAMVVEYVGEIVGLRVADKRECEYQSGRKLQYKSACYFFKIDREHIIDATCKGGIARFVNHSCMPNCVAKVISLRNEKKVVFFAERDIYPGEEITYDYHFNHEDEGEKISCFCNAKNCRRYMN